MTNDDARALGRMLRAAARLYRAQHVCDAVVAAYVAVMARYPLATVTRALYAHMRNTHAGRRFPTCADLICRIEGSHFAQ